MLLLMMTVLEVAQRLGRDPETVRRWIRSGKLPAQKVGLQHLVDESDLPVADDDVASEEKYVTTASGRRVHKSVLLQAIADVRAGR